MAEHSVTFDPSSTHPTGSFTSRILASQTPASSLVGFKAGNETNPHDNITILYGQLPTKEDIYGAGTTDTNIELTNIKLQFTLTRADTDEEYYVVQSPRDGQTINFPTEQEGTPSYDGVDFDTSGVTVQKKWYNGTDFTSAVDIFSNGVIEPEHYAYFRPHAIGTFTLDLKNYVKAKSLKFGDKFNLVIRKDSAAENANEFIEVDTSTGGYTNRTTNNFIDMILHYEDPEPSAPVIKLEADTDYRNAVVTMTTKPNEPDITSFATIWKHNGSDTVDNKTGVNYTSTNRTIISSGNAFSTGVFKQANNDITSTFLDDTGETDFLVVYAMDNSADGEHPSTVKNRTMSNAVSHARMECTASLSAGTAIGQELTLTISGIVGDGDSTAKNFSKYAVNWDNPTASGGDINNFNIVTLDSPTSSVTVKHTYDKADDYNVMVCVIDELGFRSDFVRAGGSARTIAESNPVAVLRSSRDTAVRAIYGDDFSVINLSATHSYPVGSDRIIMAHRFKHNLNTPFTTHPMDNDNTHFNDASTAIALKCNLSGCQDTTLKVFGKVSVAADGTPESDASSNFDRYEFQVNEVKPHTNNDTLGAAATTAGGELVLYKSIDFVVLSALDSDDSGAVYTLVDVADTHTSGAAATSGFGNIINNKIRGKDGTYAWGGYADLTSSITRLNFNAGAKTITRDAGGGDFITNGAVVGDTIYIDDPEDAANNGFFTVNAVTGTVLTVNESVTTNTADTTAKIYKVGPSVLPVASYASTIPTITCSVISTKDEQNTTSDLHTSSEVTQDLLIADESFNTLDLDTIAASGDIAILNVNLNRSGGLSTSMPLGGKTYPVGVTRTKMGEPLLNASIRILTQTGYRKIWNLVEGGRYQWITIDSKKVDLPSNAYKQLRLRLKDGSIDKEPSLASQYTASLNFVVIGELVS